MYTGRLALFGVLLALLFGILQQKLSQHTQPFLPAHGIPSNILLLTAHPDDECMFFGPTLTSLVDTGHMAREGTASSYSTPRSRVFSLCLSIGGADGFGELRKKEFGRSLDVFGVDETHRWILDRPELKDDMSSYWDAKVIADVIEPYILQNNITTILTFDSLGVSDHPNHKSLPRGALHLLSSFHKRNHTQSPRLFALISHPIGDKYVGPLAALLAKFDIFTAGVLQRASSPGRSEAGLPVFVAGTQGYVTALKAMRQHGSQLVWFRWLYVFFSRYMWVNEWVELVYGSTAKT